MNDITIPSERWDFMGQDLNGYFKSHLQFMERYADAEVLLQEERINDSRTMLTGEPDLLVRQGDKITLIDWKCSHAVGRHWQLQASGYDYLLKEQWPGEFVIYFVKLDKNGKAPVVTQYDANWVQFFNAYDLYTEFLRMKDDKCYLEDE
jgi:predicted RecB family nuclease